MPAHYSVVQFLPDPLADERINIGVVVYGDDALHVRFLEDWSRVRHFSPHGDGVRVAAGEMRRHLESPNSSVSSAEDLNRLARDWAYSMHVSTPKASLLGADELLEQVARSMLKDSRQPPRRLRTKATVIRDARRSLARSLDEALGAGEADELVHMRETVRGRVEPHRIDLAVRNGHVMVAAQALAFPKEETARLQEQIAATAWILKDISEAEEQPELAVIVAPPADTRRDDYTRATSLFEELSAELVMMTELDEWSTQVAQRVHDEIQEDSAEKSLTT